MGGPLVPGPGGGHLVPGPGGGPLVPDLSEPCGQTEILKTLPYVFLCAIFEVADLGFPSLDSVDLKRPWLL